MRSRTVAIMQPYFFPYAGYFRLLACSDVFVIYDSVQFPKGGRVHRSEVESGRWLTLPLARNPFGTSIRDVRLREDAVSDFERKMRAFDWIEDAEGPCAETVRGLLRSPKPSLVDYLEESLTMIADLLTIDVEIVRSSDLEIDADLRGQDRVVAVALAVGASRYLNSPGGRSLYNADGFNVAGIELTFLRPYEGRYPYLLKALLTGNAVDIRNDIHATSKIESA